MAQYLTNTTDLTSVANAIREKGGTTDPLIYPEGFVTAIHAIQTGGGEETLFGTYFETGSIIPASDITTDYTIQFQRNFLSVPGNSNIPYYNFFLWCSIPPGFTSVAVPNNSWAWVFIGRKKKNESFSYGQYLSRSGSVSNATYLGEIGDNSSSPFTLYCTTSKKLVAGYVYNWIALAPSSEGYAT